ncbi:MAG: MoaD/ThiS family protein [Gammaproteobacteria bacterium]
MTITVKFFASLRETLNRDTTSVDFAEISTITDVWNIATEGHKFPANTLAAINMEYASAEQMVNDGDEVAFFPPVTGG